MYKVADNMLADLTIKEFANKVAASEPVVPAGGCVTALSGAMGVALLEMSADSAIGHPTGDKYPEFFAETKVLLAKLHEELLTYIDGDAVAYQGVLDVYKQPNCTPEEILSRKANLQTAALAAIDVPLKISAACLAALEPGIAMLPRVKRGVLGDLKIGVLVLKTCVEATLAASRINLSLIHEEKLAESFKAQINELQTKFELVTAKLS